MRLSSAGAWKAELLRAVPVCGACHSLHLLEGTCNEASDVRITTSSLHTPLPTLVKEELQALVYAS